MVLCEAGYGAEEKELRRRRHLNNSLLSSVSISSRAEGKLENSGYHISV